MVFCGSFTSSPAVDTASRPMYEKKIVPAAEPMPATPNGTKSLRWSALYALNAMIMNMPSTPSLISTMIALTLADSLAPRINSSAHSPIRMTAGRFTQPGWVSHGAADNTCGI